MIIEEDISLCTSEGCAKTDDIRKNYYPNDKDNKKNNLLVLIKEDSNLHAEEGCFLHGAKCSACKKTCIKGKDTKENKYKCVTLGNIQHLCRCNFMRHCANVCHHSVHTFCLNESSKNTSSLRTTKSKRNSSKGG